MLVVPVHCGAESRSTSDLTATGCTQELETIMDDDEDMADLYLTVSTLLQRVFEEESACTQTYGSTLWIHAAARICIRTMC